jgi:hypothetical protein
VQDWEYVRRFIRSSYIAQVTIIGWLGSDSGFLGLLDGVMGSTSMLRGPDVAEWKEAEEEEE